MKIPATLTGLAIGDALGQPFEFMDYEFIKDIQWDGRYLPGKACGVPLNAGQWTDDTKMALALSRSLIENCAFDQENVALKYIEWYNTGDLRGIGIQTARAIALMQESDDVTKCGVIDPTNAHIFKKEAIRTDVCGNGTVMRIAPVGLFYKDDLVKVIKYAQDDAVLTHDHKDAKESSLAIAYITALLAAGEEPVTAVEECLALLSDGNIKAKIKEAMKLAEQSKRTEDALIIGDHGSAHETIGTAIFCFLRYIGDGFKLPLINAVRIGGDTDSRAAVVGALVGTKLGSDEIPEELLEVLECRDLLFAVDRLLALGPKRLENEKT